MRNFRLILLSLLFTFSSTNIFCQVNKKKSTASVARKHVNTEKVHPRIALLNRAKREEQRAMLWAMLLPCGGQIYNRTYWTAGTFACAYAATGFLTYYWHNRYLEAGMAKINNSLNDNSGRISSCERYRTMGIIGIAAVYILGIVEAYSTASLKTFDISDDLSFIEEPRNKDKKIGLDFGLKF